MRWKGHNSPFSLHRLHQCQTRREKKRLTNNKAARRECWRHMCRHTKSFFCYGGRWKDIGRGLPLSSCLQLASRTVSNEVTTIFPIYKRNRRKLSYLTSGVATTVDNTYSSENIEIKVFFRRPRRERKLKMQLLQFFKSCISRSKTHEPKKGMRKT